MSVREYLDLRNRLVRQFSTGTSNQFSYQTLTSKRKSRTVSSKKMLFFLHLLVKQQIFLEWQNCYKFRKYKICSKTWNRLIKNYFTISPQLLSKFKTYVKLSEHFLSGISLAISFKQIYYFLRVLVKRNEAWGWIVTILYKLISIMLCAWLIGRKCDEPFNPNLTLKYHIGQRGQR